MECSGLEETVLLAVFERLMPGNGGAPIREHKVGVFATSDPFVYSEVIVPNIPIADVFAYRDSAIAEISREEGRNPQDVLFVYTKQFPTFVRALEHDLPFRARYIGATGMRQGEIALGIELHEHFNHVAWKNNRHRVIFGEMTDEQRTLPTVQNAQKGLVFAAHMRDAYIRPMKKAIKGEDARLFDEIGEELLAFTRELGFANYGTHIVELLNNHWNYNRHEWGLVIDTYVEEIAAAQRTQTMATKVRDKRHAKAKRMYSANPAT